MGGWYQRDIIQATRPENASSNGFNLDLAANSMSCPEDYLAHILFCGGFHFFFFMQGPGALPDNEIPPPISIQELCFPQHGTVLFFYSPPCIPKKVDVKAP